MRLAVVGVGGAGSRVVNQIRDRERATGRNLCDGNTLLVNSARPTFDGTEHVPEERRLVVGDVRLGGADGDGDDPDHMAAVAREERNEINRAFDLLEFHQVGGVLVAAGLAGATGGGAGVVVLDQLAAVADGPVYGVGVLPNESEGQRAALHAARSLRSFVERADNVLVFDNDAWVGPDGPVGPRPTADGAGGAADPPSDADRATGNEGPGTPTETGPTDGRAAGPPADPASGAYAGANAALAERLVALFAAGEFSGTAVPETRLDPSDVKRILDTGGVSTIGYAAADVTRPAGLRARFRDVYERVFGGHDVDGDADAAHTDAAKINRLVRGAARSKLTLPCAVSSADRALVVLSGPPGELSRKGFESGRYWLESEADVVDVMAGDVPHDGSTSLSAVVLFSNVTEVPRIDRMQESGVAYRADGPGSKPLGSADPP